VQFLRLLLLRLRDDADAAVRLAKEVDRDLTHRAPPIMCGQDLRRQRYTLE
jgi:hypothetical protein